MCSAIMEEGTETHFSDYVMEMVMIYFFTTAVATAIVYTVPLLVNWNLLYLSGVVLFIPLVKPLVKKFVPRKKISPAGKAVLITGCDTGFGHLLAQRLDDLGFQVFAGCLLPNGDGAADLRKSGSSRLHVVGLDVTSDSSVQEAAAYVKENLKNNVLWAVVNNAGIGCFGDISWTSMEKVVEVFEVNAMGAVRVTKEFLPTLMKTKGRVITVASIGGWLISPGFVPYCMTKSAVISFSEGLRLEMRKWGVRSISILPYLYRTPICSEEATTALVKKEWDRAPKVIKAIYGPDYISKYLKRILSQFNTLGRRNVNEVVSVMEESIVTLFPESSYSVGGTAYISLFRIAKYLLPEAVIDLVLCKFVSKREV